MELITVIEISPLKYSKEQYEFAEIIDLTNPEEWYRRWVAAVSTLNLDFDTLDKNSYFVDIETIDDKNLQIVLEVNLQEIDVDKFEIQMMSFDGGIALKENDQILITPSCCGDIGNIKEWQKMVENNSTEWSELWIGHPWVFYKKENGKIQFSDYSDSSLNEMESIQPIFEVDGSELKIEIEKVKKQQINFKNRIFNILKKMKIENAEKISEVMTGIE